MSDDLRATAIERAAEAMVWHRWPNDPIQRGDREQAARAVDAVLALLADPAPEAAREGGNHYATITHPGRKVDCSICAPADLPVATGVTTEDVNRVARLLMGAWERAEGKPVNVSYVATFADMARAVLAAPAPVVSAGDEGVGLREDEREALADAVANISPTAVWLRIASGARNPVTAAVERIIAARVAEAGARDGAVLEAAHAAADELDEWDGEASSRLGGCSPGGVVRGEVHEAFGVEIDDCPACAKRADL